MKEKQEDLEPLKRIRSAVREALNGHESYQELRRAIDAVQRTFREEFAAGIREPLNEEASARPQATYAEKRELAHWINAEMRQMGLALRCPRSGLPSIIHAGVSHIPGGGRFRLDSVDEQGRHSNHTASLQLPPLEPIPDPNINVPLRTKRDRPR